ncbi:TPM domain-containing protein [Candidatus Margulisiibacteriota bacterium]
MKLIVLILLLFCALPVHSQQIQLPEQQGAISDYFDVVDDRSKVLIQDLARELKRVTSINLAVVIVRSTAPLPVEAYGRLLYDKWDVGNKAKGLDHGILLLVAVVEHDVKMIIGKDIDFMIPQLKKEEMELSFFPYLDEGKFAAAAFGGAATVSRHILNEWPRYRGRYIRLEMQSASLVLFVLTVLAIFLTTVYGGTFMTIFATVVGGMFGWLFYGLAGMALGAGIGFITNLGEVVRPESPAEKELKRIHDHWKEHQKEEEREHENMG